MGIVVVGAWLQWITAPLEGAAIKEILARMWNTCRGTPGLGVEVWEEEG